MIKYFIFTLLLYFNGLSSTLDNGELNITNIDCKGEKNIIK
jgi:hypothetical protein